MPIFIKEDRWNETVSEVSISIGLRNEDFDYLDYEITSKFLRVTFGHHIYELALQDSVIPNSTRAMEIRDHFKIIMRKTTRGKWESLGKDLNKEEMDKVRSEAKVELSAILNKKAEDRKEQKRKNLNNAVEEQMERNHQKLLEQQQIIREEKRKFFEKSKKANMEEGKAYLARRMMPSTDESGSEHHSIDEGHDSPLNGDCIETDSESDQETSREAELPAIRDEQVVPISLTDAATPARESQSEMQVPKAEEQPESPDVSYSQKGIELYEKKDFQGAINAYTEACAMAPSRHEYFINRAAAYYCVGKYTECIADASKGLTLLEGKNEKNKLLYTSCYVRRGASYLQLNQHDVALIDYECALALYPENEGLILDVRKLKLLHQPSTSSESSSALSDDSDLGEEASDCDVFYDSDEACYYEDYE